MAQLLQAGACDGSVVVERDVRIPTRDGGFIAADIHRPAGPGPFPTLYAVSPYGKESVDLPAIPTFRQRETGDSAFSWEDVSGGVGRRAARDLIPLLQQLGAPPQLAQFSGLPSASASAVARGGRGETVSPVGDPQPAGRTGLRDAEGVGDLRGRCLALAGHGGHVTTELRRERLGHDADPSSEIAAPRARSQPNRGRALTGQLDARAGTRAPPGLPCRPRAPGR
jgi:hypothetical protein